VTGNSFIDALHSASPAADRADKMKLYSWLIGHWTMDAIVYRDDGTKHEGPGEIHFGWVLEGRAIQDVWILPGIFYGTTLRVYDPDLDAWHILWCDPLRQFYTAKLDVHMATTSSSREPTMREKRYAGALPMSPPNRSAGSANARAITAKHGSFRPSSWLGACSNSKPHH